MNKCSKLHATQFSSYSSCVQARLCTCRSDDYMSAHLDISYTSKRPLELTGKTYTCIYVPPGLQYFVELL